MTFFIHHALSRRLWQAGLASVLLATACSVTAQSPRPESKPPASPPFGQEQASLAELRTAEAHYQQGHIAQALEGFTALVERYPRNAYFWFRLGNCLAKTGDLRSAMGAYDNAIVIDPSDARFHFNLAQMHLGLAKAALQAASGHSQNGQDLAPEAGRLLDGLARLQEPAPTDKSEQEPEKASSETM